MARMVLRHIIKSFGALMMEMSDISASNDRVLENVFVKSDKSNNLFPLLLSALTL
jgi:hypothetical protein